MIALNLIYYSPYEYGLDLKALIMFALGSFILISILLFYYNRISKGNSIESELDNPIFQVKDVLLSSISSDSKLIITQSIDSIWVKILVFLLITLVVIIPADQILML